MIPVFIFYLHVVAAVYVFTRRWQEEGYAEAFLAVGFMALVFFVGWSVATFIMKLFVGQAGFGKFFDRDAMSLTLLTAIEVGLYYLYFFGRKRKKRLTRA
jgi:uncharacterized membrane protein YhdT